MKSDISKFIFVNREHGTLTLRSVNTLNMSNLGVFDPMLFWLFDYGL